MDPRRPGLLTLDVANLERALAFWHEALGVPIKLRAEGYAELQTETVLISLQETAEPETGPGPALGWEAHRSKSPPVRKRSSSSQSRRSTWNPASVYGG